MSELKLSGKIKVIYDTQTFDSGFSKREFVITTNEQYPQDVKFEAVKDKCALLDTVNVGDQVDVSMNIRGSEYNGKYYVNLQAWKIWKVNGGQTSGSPQSNPSQMEDPIDEQDDLPF